MEVKCCMDEKGLQSKRTNATRQLQAHKDILICNFGISSMEADKVQLHTVWPNLSENEPCYNTKCEDNNSHLRFQAKPKQCWPPGTISKKGVSKEPKFEGPGWHLFEDDVNNFKVILHKMITDTTLEIEEKTWIRILRIR